MDFYECLDSFTQRSEPFSFVYNLGKLVAQFLSWLSMVVTVKDQLLQLLVSFHQDGSARCLVNAAGFHTNDTVLYDINDTDAVFRRRCVFSSRDDLGNLHLLAIECLVGTPFSKVMVTYSVSLSGAFSGVTLKTSMWS